MDELKKDTRFAHITKDPRFRPASAKERKVKIDRRFASMFKDPKFKLKYTVDKRGRPLVQEHTTRDDMNKFYRLDNDDDQSSSSTSDEEGSTKTKRKPITGDDELDEILQSDESENEEEEEEEEKKSGSSDEDEDVPEPEDDTDWNEFDDKCTRSENVSRRLAVCNMDWDRVRAVDIFLLLNSWKPADGVIKSVTIYPSEYGLKQMDIEKKLGPLPGTTQPVTSNDQNGADSGHQSEVEAEEEPELPEVKSDDDEELNEENYNQDDDQDVSDPVMRERLRKYQLNRLKYYYAVVECDTVETAARIYEECDGLEYETSAVRLDLRFIPDSVTFDSSIPPQDQCTELPEKSIYKPILFRNTALTQTKVRCTWDETPIERRRLIKKKYTEEEIEKIDLNAYLASGSEDEAVNDDDNAASDLDDDDDNTDDEKEKQNDDGVFKVPTTIPSESKKNKKKDQPIARAPSILSSQDDIDRYRSLLLDFNDDSKTKKKPKKKITNFFDEEPSGDEDEEFPRATKQVDDDDDDDDDPSDIDMEITWQPGLKSKVEEKFQNKKKPEQNSKLETSPDHRDDHDDEQSETHRDSLELLTVDDELDDKRDYNLRHMMKEHKQTIKAEAKKKKNPKKFDKISSKPSDDQFQVNVNDKRFQAVYNKAAFNIDQSDPHFKSTAGTQRIIDEKLKKRKFPSNETDGSRTGVDSDDLVAKLKRKSAKKD